MAQHSQHALDGGGEVTINLIVDSMGSGPAPGGKYSIDHAEGELAQLWKGEVVNGAFAQFWSGSIAEGAHLESAQSDESIKEPHAAQSGVGVKGALSNQLGAAAVAV